MAVLGDVMVVCCRQDANEVQPRLNFAETYGDPAPAAPQMPTGQGKCALAVYDYQAGKKDDIDVVITTNITFTSCLI